MRHLTAGLACRPSLFAWLAVLTLVLSACSPAAAPAPTSAPAARPTEPAKPAAPAAAASPAVAAAPSPAPAAAAATSPSAPPASPAAPAASPAASAPKPAAATGPRTAVTIPLAAAAISGLPFYVAADQGFFAAHGVDVTIQTMAGNVAQAALTKGEIQFLSSPTDSIAGYANGLPFKVVYECWESAPWALVGKKDIPNLAGMKGKTVAASRPGSSPYYYLEAGLKSAGLTLNDVSPILTSGTEGSYAALAAGQVDAAVLSPPYDSQAELNGFQTIAPLGQYLQTPYIGLATSTSYLQEHRDVVVNVIRGLMDAADWIKANPQGSVAVYTKWSNADPALSQRAYTTMAPLLAKTGETNLEGVKQQFQQLESTLNKQITLDPAGAIDDGPRQEALRR